MLSPQNPLYGSGTPDAPTKSESSVGSCSWIDSMLETYSKEKSTSLRGIIIIVSYATITGKKPLSTSFSCFFNQTCWSALNIHWNFTTDFYTMMNEAKSQFPHKFFHGRLHHCGMVDLETEKQPHL
jgi:hypothetical protein